MFRSPRASTTARGRRLQVRRNFEAGPPAPAAAQICGRHDQRSGTRTLLPLAELLIPLLGAHRLFANAVHGLDFDFVVEHAQVAPDRELNIIARSANAGMFRVAAGRPIIRVTEMLHYTTFWKVRVPMLHNCPNFSSQKQSRDREMADSSSKGWRDARIVGK